MAITKISDIIDHIPAARDAAITKVLGNAKWMERIADAYDWLLQQDEIEHYGDIVLMPSDNSNDVYSTNGHCNCQAGQQGIMCKHRVRARLFKLAVEKSQVVKPVMTYQTPLERIENEIAVARDRLARGVSTRGMVEQLEIEKARMLREKAIREMNELFV